MMDVVEWVSEEEEEKEEEVADSPAVEMLGHNVLEISLHATKPSAMRLVGKIGVSKMVILVNTGSTHNFQDPSIAKKNNLQVTKYN